MLAPASARWLDRELLPAALRNPSPSVRYMALADTRIEEPIAFRTDARGVLLQLTAPEHWQRFAPIAGTALNCAWEGGVLPLE